MAKEKQRILVIVGPTSSGKSALGVSLARTLNGEIICADSRQVYRGLNIGAGKITKPEMRGVTHHLLDVASPKQVFNAHQFTQEARKTISDISRRDHLPIIVGGTGFYIDALVGRVSLPDVGINKKFRAQLEKKTTTQLYAILKKHDRARAKALSSPSERNNKVRLIRALEIAIARKIRPQHIESAPSYDVYWIGLAPKNLDARIGCRLKARIKNGMIAEGRRLHAQGLSYKRMRQLGLEYGALADLLERNVTREEFEERLFREIRRYGKKQLAYWKRNKEIIWLQPSSQRRIKSDLKRWMRS